MNMERKQIEGGIKEMSDLYKKIRVAKRDNKMLARAKEDMTEVELRYYLTLLDEAVFNKGITFTDHALERMKTRNLGKGKIQYVVREGDLAEIQFDDEGQNVKAVISYATKGQYKKGFTSCVVYELSTGKVISVWNRKLAQEDNKCTTTYDCGHRVYAVGKGMNTLDLAKEYIGSIFEGEDLVKFIRKYDKTPFTEKTQKKLHNYLTGVTPIYQL